MNVFYKEHEQYKEIIRGYDESISSKASRVAVLECKNMVLQRPTYKEQEDEIKVINQKFLKNINAMQELSDKQHAN